MQVYLKTSLGRNGGNILGVVRGGIWLATPDSTHIPGSVTPAPQMLLSSRIVTLPGSVAGGVETTGNPRDLGG